MKMPKTLLLLSLLFVTCCYFRLQSQNDSIVVDSSIIRTTTTYAHRSDTTTAALHFRDGFKEEYRGRDLEYTEKESKPGLLSKFLEWLFQNKTSKTETPLFWISFFKICIAMTVLYGVYVIANTLMGKEGNWLFASKSEGVKYGVSEADIADTDYNLLIKDALSEGNFRMAIRYHYLLTLQKLTLKGLISYHMDKTNSDYLYELKEKNLSQSFRYVSYIYDHVWYGGFDFSVQEYDKARAAFDKVTKMI